MRYAGTRNPRAETNPLRSIPLFKPAATVLAPGVRQVLEANLKAARVSIATSTEHLAAACASLGRANRLKGYARRRYQGEAFRWINRARANLRAARKALAAAEAGLLALDTDLFGGLA